MVPKLKLRTQILFVFLVLLAVSSVITISFTYARNSGTIRKMAQDLINAVKELIVDKISCMAKDLERLPQMEMDYFNRYPSLSLENKELIFYFLDTFRYYPTLAANHIATPDGNALIFFNLAVADKPYSFTNTKTLPKGTSYAIVFVNRSGGTGKEVWAYYDENLEPISKEEIPFQGYDPRDRPWYIGAVKEGKLFWTDVFSYVPTGNPGIAIAMPVYNEKKELICVIAADLSLHLFSLFMTNQSIGKTGKAFILNESGELIIPTSIDTNTRINHKVLSDAYSKFAKEKQSDFLFKSGGEKYLAAIHSFPLSFENHWFIVIIDPLTDYFGEIIKTGHRVVLISLLILLVAGLLVIFFSRRISAPIVALSEEINKITRLDLESDKRVKSNVQEIYLIDSSIADMRIALRSFSRYVPKEIVKELLLRGQDIVVGGEMKFVTTLFADLTGFTPITETYPIKTVNALLAEYFDGLSKIILAHQGNIDKYTGDGLMAMWGAPQPIEEPEEKACTAALLCQSWESSLNRSRRERNLPEFHTRFGIDIEGLLYRPSLQALQ